MSSVSGEPLMRAQVLLTRVQPPNTPSQTPIIITTGSLTPGQIPPFVTGRDGKFEIKDLEAGQYCLRVVRNGYAPQEYGQRTLTTSGIPITLIEGQQLKDVTFKLIAAGVVTGRVRDFNGEPVGRAQVSLMRTIYSVNGQRNYSSAGSSGGYRLYSWEAIEANAYFDRDVLSQYESQGRPVRIQEGSKENDLKLIPVKQ